MLMSCSSFGIHSFIKTILWIRCNINCIDRSQIIPFSRKIVIWVRKWFRHGQTLLVQVNLNSKIDNRKMFTKNSELKHHMIKVILHHLTAISQLGFQLHLAVMNTWDWIENLGWRLVKTSLMLFISGRKSWRIGLKKLQYHQLLRFYKFFHHNDLWQRQTSKPP